MRIAGFEFAEGSRFQSGEHPTADIVGTHIEMLREKFKGELTPEDILEDAKHDNSPLHSFFEWSDTTAAHQHRLAQARGLIRSVVAIYVQDDAPAVRQRAYVNIKKANEPQHYRELTHALSQSDTREVVLRRAWSEFHQWRQRYKDLKEFAEFFDSAAEFERKLLGKPN